MQGIKKSDLSRESLVMALSEKMGTKDKENDEPDLAKIDSTTGTYFNATIGDVPTEILDAAVDYFNADAVALRTKAEASTVTANINILNKRATFSRLAAQAIELYYKEHRQ